MKEDQIIKEYFKKMRDLKLSESSHARIEENLLSYARFHTINESVRVGEVGRYIEQVPSRTSFIARLLNLRFTRMITTLLIALILGGGTSFAAEGAVPGDFLYSVKVEFNENVQAAFAVTNESKARLQAKLVEKRLEEAETLASRGELTTETSAEISAKLKEHYTKAKERSDKEAENGNIESSGELRASLEGTFRSYAGVLGALNSEIKGNEGRALIADINTYANAQAHAQATATVDVSENVEADMEDMIARVEVMTNEAQEVLTAAKADLEASVYARISARVAEMVAVESEAKVQLKAKLYKDAYQSAQKAIRLAHQVEIMVKSALRVNVNIIAPVDVGVDGLINVRSTTTNKEDKANQGRGTDIETDINLDTTIDTRLIDAEATLNTKGRIGL